jgi:hypothetical protein
LDTSGVTVATRDGYYFIDVTWKSGFKHTIPCRGYNLKSEIAFNDSLFWVESFNYYEVTEQQYEEKLWGAGYPADIEKTTTKSTTASKRKATAETGVKQSATKRSATPATKSTKKKDQSSAPTKKRSSGSTTTRKTKDGTIPKPKRATKARQATEESKEASPKVPRKKRTSTKDGKQDGKRSVTPNKRQPKPAA